jgi:hypothetical protein
MLYDKTTRKTEECKIGEPRRAGPDDGKYSFL